MDSQIINDIEKRLYIQSIQLSELPKFMVDKLPNFIKDSNFLIYNRHKQKLLSTNEWVNHFNKFYLKIFKFFNDEELRKIELFRQDIIIIYTCKDNFIVFKHYDIDGLTKTSNGNTFITKRANIAYNAHSILFFKDNYNIKTNLRRNAWIDLKLNVNLCCIDDILYHDPYFKKLRLIKDEVERLNIDQNDLSQKISYNHVIDNLHRSKAETITTIWKSAYPLSKEINLNKHSIFDIYVFHFLYKHLTKKEFHRVFNWYIKKKKEITKTLENKELVEHFIIQTPCHQNKIAQLIYVFYLFENNGISTIGEKIQKEMIDQNNIYSLLEKRSIIVDTLKMMKNNKLKWEITTKSYKRLKTIHDDLSTKQNLKKQEKIYKENKALIKKNKQIFEPLVKKLKTLENVKLLLNANDLSIEASVMKHCVESYLYEVLKYESIIFHLSYHSEECTVQINKAYKIQQCFKKFNELPSIEVFNYIEQLLEEVKKER